MTMQNYPAQQIAIRLEFRELPDGRLYVTSPDLFGFNTAVDPDEEPMDALRAPLSLFLSHYLGAEISSIDAAMEPVSYRAHSIGLPLSDHKKPGLLLAAVA